MKIVKENATKMDFDFQAYYRNLGKVENELEKIKIEALYFKYYDKLSKELQIIFKNEDKKVRISEANHIQKEINLISQSI